MRPWLLVLDSDLAVVNAFKKAFERRGFFLVATHSMQEAIGALEVGQPEALILEIRVPGPPGVEFLHDVHDAYPNLPIIVMTAFSTSFTESDARREGAAAYFVKPFDIDTMIEALRKTKQTKASTPLVGPAAKHRLQPCSEMAPS